jgi:phosphoglycolate phosphatase
MIKHIIWDWNGTLLDDVEACMTSINRMLAVRNLPTISIDQYRDIFDFPVKNYYQTLGFDLQTENWDDMANEFHRHYAELSPNAELRNGIRNTLASIAELDIPMSILSACEINILERMLREHNIRNFFQFVFGLDNLYAASKLDRGIKLMQKLNIPPQEILMIGDTNHDYEVAQELGIHCILLSGGHQSDQRLNAAQLIKHPNELIHILHTLNS